MNFNPPALILIPILCILGGGYISVPVTSLTGGKEPFTTGLTLLLFAAILWLAGIHALSASPVAIFLAWAAGSTSYLILGYKSGFRHHIESFFVAHMLTLVGLAALIWVSQ